MASAMPERLIHGDLHSRRLDGCPRVVSLGSKAFCAGRGQRITGAIHAAAVAAATHAEESTRVAADWVREEKLRAALPNPPRITTGEVAA